MSIGKQSEQQGTMWVAYDEIPKGMGHAFYDHLQKILCQGGFDTFVEKLCAEYYQSGEKVGLEIVWIKIP